MNKKEVASLLKQRRSDAGLSAKDVINSLKARGIEISDKTLYGYESGVSMPNVPTFICLCEIYGIHDVFGSYNNSDPHLLRMVSLASDEWTTDQYEDFFKADAYSKIYLLLNCGIPSFQGYEAQFQNLMTEPKKDELQLLDDYRALSPDGKKYILQTMAMARRTYSEKNDAVSDVETAG